MKRSVTVLGGGIGGVVTANLLRKQLPSGCEVALIDREMNHVFAPSLPWLMTGNRTARRISRPLSRLKKRRIDFIQGEIEQIDGHNRTVSVNGEKITSDYLVISLGAALSPEDIPGLNAEYSFYDLESAERLKHKLREFREGHVVILTASPIYKCPAAPYEAALLIHSYFKKRGIRRRVQMSFYAAEPAPLGVAGSNVTNAVLEMLAKRQISYHAQHQITRVDPNRQELHFANGLRESYDLLIYVPPHKAPTVLQDSGLVDESGWVSVDRHTLETKIPGVFAIGDVASIPLRMGKPLPKAGVFAHVQAKVVANNIAKEITGKGEPMQFDGHGTCFIEIGRNKAGMASGNFYASPTPSVKMHHPGKLWHIGKVLFERSWFRTWFR